MSDLCGVVLAAGWGTRLAGLSSARPKASFPIGQSSLLDRAIRTLSPFASDIAVNYCGFPDWFADHVPKGVQQFAEGPEPFGTAGALVNMRSWIAGRDVVVLNADSALFGDVSTFFRHPSRSTTLLVTFDRSRPDFHGVWRFAGLSLMTRESLEQLSDTADDLYHDLWKHQLTNGDAALHPFAGLAVDCGTPLDLLAANLLETAGESLVEDGAHVEGELESTVVLNGGTVRKGQSVANSIVGPNGTFCLD